MNKKILLAISALLILGLAVAAFAYGTKTSSRSAVDCCCKGAESCPMMKEKSGKTEGASCCDKEDCCCKGGGDSCCKGDSCPMKKKDEGKSGEKSGHSCCDKETPKKDG